MILMAFKTMKAMFETEKRRKRFFNQVGNIGKVKCEVWETQIPLVWETADCQEAQVQSVVHYPRE